MDYRGLSLEDWRPIVEEWRESGQSMAAWCRDREVPEHLLYYWRDKLDQKKRPAAQFVSLTDPPSQIPLLIHCGDYQVEVAAQFDEEHLIRCLRLLRRAL